MGLKTQAGAIALGIMASAGVSAQTPQAEPKPIAIAIIDSDVRKLDFEDPNVRFVDLTPAPPQDASFMKFKVTDRYSHGDIVASSFVKEYRRLDPTAPIVIYTVDPFVRHKGDASSNFSISMLNQALPKMREAGVSVAISAFGISDAAAGDRIASAFTRNGISLFAAVPNDPNDRGIYPAASRGVISVTSEKEGGAFDHDRSMATWVALSINGNHGSAHNLSDAGGTSFSTPKAAAYGAFIARMKPDIDVDTLRHEIMSRGTAIGGMAGGRPRITARIGSGEMVDAVRRDFALPTVASKSPQAENPPQILASARGR